LRFLVPSGLGPGGCNAETVVKTVVPDEPYLREIYTYAPMHISINIYIHVHRKLPIQRKAVVKTAKPEELD